MLPARRFLEVRLMSVPTHEPVAVLDRSSAVERGGADDVAAELVVEELLVEEISIDGMCGVY